MAVLCWYVSYIADDPLYLTGKSQPTFISAEVIAQLVKSYLSVYLCVNHLFMDIIGLYSTKDVNSREINFSIRA